MIDTTSLSDREILEKLMELTSQNHAMVCNMSKSFELEKHRQFRINEAFEHRLGCIENDVIEIKKKIAV